MFKDKKIVVTGGSGFIGTHMIEELINRGAIVRSNIHSRKPQTKISSIDWVEDCDLKNLEKCLKLIDGADYVIHLAGGIANPKQVPTDFQISLDQITLLTNVIDASRQCNVKKFFDLNSGTGYPLRNYPIKENEFWDDEPYISYYGYGWMRRYREKVYEHCSHISDMEIKIGRATAIFGEYDNFDEETCHVIPALIKRSFRRDNPFIVWGTPDVVRDFLYVKDVVKGCLLILDEGVNMRPYNVGSGESVTIGDVVDAIMKATNNNTKIVYDSTKPTTIPFKLSNIDRIKSELKFKPDYSFYQGIKNTVDWYSNEL